MNPNRIRFMNSDVQVYPHACEVVIISLNKLSSPIYLFYFWNSSGSVIYFIVLYRHLDFLHFFILFLLLCLDYFKVPVLYLFDSIFFDVLHCIFTSFINPSDLECFAHFYDFYLCLHLFWMLYPRDHIILFLWTWLGEYWDLFVMSCFLDFSCSLELCIAFALEVAVTSSNH